MADIPDGGIMSSIQNPRECTAKTNEVFNPIQDPFWLMNDCEDKSHQPQQEDQENQEDQEPQQQDQEPQQQQEQKQQKKSESCECQQTVREIQNYDNIFIY